MGVTIIALRATGGRVESYDSKKKIEDLSLFSPSIWKDTHISCMAIASQVAILNSFASQSFNVGCNPIDTHVGVNSIDLNGIYC